MNQEQFNKNMSNLEIIIENYKKEIDTLKKSKEKYKKELKKIYNIIDNIGLKKIDDLEKLNELYNKNKNNYKVCNIVELIKYIYGIDENITKFLKEYNFNDVEELQCFVTKYNNHKCDISDIYSYDILIKNPLYKSLVEVNSVLVKNINNTPKVTLNNVYKNRCIELLKVNNLNNYIKQCKYITCNKYINNDFEYCFKHFSKITNKDNSEIHQNKYKYIEDIIKYTVDISKVYEFINYNREKTFEEICKIPLPLITQDEETLLNVNINNNKTFKNTLKSKNKTIIRNNYKKIDQQEEINNVLGKIIKSKNIGKRRYIDFYNIRLKENRCKLEKYSYYSVNNENLSEEEKVDFFNEENITLSNESRFNKYTKIFHKIYNNTIINNSDYIFLPNTFKNINSKNIDILIYKLELLCNGSDIEIIKNINKIHEEVDKHKYVDNIHIIKSLNIKLL